MTTKSITDIQMTRSDYSTIFVNMLPFLLSCYHFVTILLSFVTILGNVLPHCYHFR